MYLYFVYSYVKYVIQQRFGGSNIWEYMWKFNKHDGYWVKLTNTYFSSSMIETCGFHINDLPARQERNEVGNCIPLPSAYCVILYSYIVTCIEMKMVIQG